MGVTISRKIAADPDSDLCFAHKDLHRATKSHFSFECILKVNSIGGTLWKAKHKLTKKEILLLEIPKISVLNNRRTHQIVNELEVLKSINHPLLPNLRYAFHDPLKLFMGFDYLGGGTLAQHLKKRGCLNEFEAKFLVTCLLTVVEYLHNQNIIHGNITPDNLVFSSEGYLHLCDFKMARMIENRSETDLAYEDFQYDQDLSYSAPEFLLKKNIAKSVDYYSIGLIAYEMMVGNNPLEGKGRKEIIKTLNSGGSIQIRKSELPEEWSFDAADFVNRLIQINPEHRLGSLGFYQIKAHPWLKDFPWQKIEDKTLDIPFRPKNEKQYKGEDRQNSGGKAKSHQDLREANEEERQSIRRSKVNFMMFDYDYYSDKEKKNLALGKSLENGELGIPTMMLGNLSKMLNVENARAGYAR